MSETKKDPWKTIKTPKAPAFYIYLMKPDTKFSAEGKYSVTLQFDPKNNPEHAKFITELDKMNQEVFDRRIKNVKRDKEDYRLKKLFRVEYDKATDKPNGLLSLKVATKNPTFGVWGPKATEGQLPKESLKGIGGGSTCRVEISLKEWEDSSKKTIGYVCYLSKIQFIDIKQWTKGNDGAPGFSDEEGTDERKSFTGDTGDPSDGDTSGSGDF